MNSEAIARAEQLVKNTALPLTDEGFTPQMAREMILAYHGALAGLVEHMRGDQPASGADAVAEQPAPPPLLASDLSRLFERYGAQTLEVMQLDHGMFAVMETRRALVAITGDEKSAEHVATFFDIT